MGLGKSSLDLQIESAPSPICRGLAGLQHLYQQITECDFSFLRGFAAAAEILEWKCWFLWNGILEILGVGNVAQKSHILVQYSPYSVTHALQ